MSGPDEAPCDFRGHALQRLGVERIAAEEINLLQLRKQARARFAARRALHLVDRQVLARSRLIRIELVASVVMPRDHKNVATCALLAGLGKPVGAPSDHELAGW